MQRLPAQCALVWTWNVSCCSATNLFFYGNVDVAYSFRTLQGLDDDRGEEAVEAGVLSRALSLDASLPMQSVVHTFPKKKV